MAQIRKEPFPTSNKQGGGLSLLVRLFWMVIGNFILFFMVCGICAGQNKGLGLKDAIYAIVVVLLVLTRYIDIRYLGGLTAQGAPASMTHWYRYSAGLIIGGGVVLGLAHIVNHLLA